MEEHNKKSHVARNVIIAIVVIVIILGLIIVSAISCAKLFNHLMSRDDVITGTLNNMVNEMKNEINEVKEIKENVNQGIVNVQESTVQENVKQAPQEDTSINIGGYKIASGTYIGYENMFDWEEQKSYKVEIKVTISKNSIVYDGKTTTYTTSGNQIIVNGIPVIQAVGTNKLQSLAQSMPMLAYQGY